MSAAAACHCPWLAGALREPSRLPFPKRATGSSSGGRCPQRIVEVLSYGQDGDRPSGDWQIHPCAKSVGNANRTGHVPRPGEQFACQPLGFCGCFLHTKARAVAKEVAVKVDEANQVGPASFMAMVIRFAFEQHITREQLFLAGAKEWPVDVYRAMNLRGQGQAGCCTNDLGPILAASIARTILY